MITIIVDNQNEYDDMMKFAENYVCKHLPFATCAMYAPGTCDKCFKDNHIKWGIRVIPLDSDNPKEL